MKRTIRSALLSCAISGASAAGLLTPTLAAAQNVVYVQPPAARTETRPAERRGFVWTAGHWEWNGRRHVWARGHYVRARRNSSWQEPRWEQRPGTRTGWVYTPGRWVRPPQGQPPAITPPPAPPPSPPAPPPIVEYPDVRTPPARIAAGVALGRPRNLERGDTAGYWIWIDRGGTWHLRVTTAGRLRHFQGRISPQGGAQIAIVGTTRTELRDRVVVRPNAAHFDFETQRGVDGVDFRVANSGCVRFRLRLDGEGDVKRVFLGANATPAPDSHFLVCQ